MQPIAIAIFAMTMLLALTVLIMEKRSRDSSTARVNRGLRDYVAANSAVPAPQETHGEDLIPA